MPSMGYIGAVDPGCRGCGVSFWGAGTLKAAAHIKNRINNGLGLDSAAILGEDVARRYREQLMQEGAFNGRLSRLVVEVPRVFPMASQ